MRERCLQRCAPSFVGRLHLMKDAPPRQLQSFAFLAPLDFMNIRTLPVGARGALVLGILPIRLNCDFNFEALIISASKNPTDGYKLHCIFVMLDEREPARFQIPIATWT